MHIDIAAGFDAYIAANQKTWNHDRTQSLGASEVFGCLRKAWYAKHNTAQDDDYEQSWGATTRGDVIENSFVVPANRDYPALINGTEARAVSSAALDEGRARFMLSFECEEGRKYSAMPVFQGRFEENYTRQNGVYSCSPRNAFIARKKTVEMDFAWTLTVHRTQGSQYDDVVLFDESNSFRDSADQWAYTGLTRAAKTLTVLV